jgi:hypothetical protein
MPGAFALRSGRADQMILPRHKPYNFYGIQRSPGHQAFLPTDEIDTFQQEFL